jgi:hypothetical protein
MDNLNSDMSARPDPPGSSYFVSRYIDGNFDGAGTASPITDHSRMKSPSEKHCVSCSHAPNSPTLPTNTNKLNTNNDNDATALSTSKDPPTNDNATLSPDNVVLLSTVFPQHSLMVNHFQEYATTKGFLLVR